MTAAPPSAFGSMIASGLVGATASRSASTRPVCRLFTRTMRYGRDVLAIASLRKLAAASRARALPSHAIESSRSIINASAPLDIALSSFFALSAGTKRSERIRIYFDRNLLGPHAHERLTAALGHELVILVIGAMMKFDDPGAGERFRFALADYFRRAMYRVAFEQRMREFDVGHAEIGDRGANCHIRDLDTDHQAEREQRIHQWLAPLGLLLAKMSVDVQWLRVKGHVGEQHVVHLRDGPRIAMLDCFAGDEILEIETAALVPCGRLLRHFGTSLGSPWLFLGFGC